MKRKGKKRYVFLYIQAGILSFVGLFIIIGLMTTFLSIRISADFMNTALRETDSQKVFHYFLASENKYFAANQNPLEDISITKLAFQLMTNVKPDDYRTFLGKEIPGFSEFDTKIEVAGQGTDFTTLPEESSPPMEVLLKEKEVSQEMLTEDSKENKDSNPKPSQTTNGRKVVYLYHTHSWESFLPLLKNANTPDDAVSSDERVNVIGVGKKLKQNLESKGIGVEQSTVNATEKLHNRGWNANQSYRYSRSLVKEATATNKDLTYAIDIHRDALRKEKTTINIKGKSYARLVFVIGKANPNYEENLEFAKNLHKELEKKYPGISRGVLAKGRDAGNGLYNQDLSKHSILLEAGGVDNNMQELDNSMEAFAGVFSDYFWKQNDAEKY